MRVQNTVTFILSKNYGRPLSVSLPVWRVYVGAAALGLLVVLLCVLSVLYVLSYQRVRQMEHETRQLRQERDQLREQILSANQEAYEAKERAFLAALGGPRRAPQASADDLALRFGETQYQPPIRVLGLTTRVSGHTVEVSFRLENQGEASNNRGGFLFAIFENEESSPPEYVATPSVNTNADGFPETYKVGVRFTRIRDAVTFRRKVKRASEESYFTHVTLYLFTVRGGLIVRERFELERDQFYKEQPVVRSQQISNA